MDQRVVNPKSHDKSQVQVIARAGSILRALDTHLSAALG